MKPGRIGFILALFVAIFTATSALLLLLCGYVEAWHVPWFEQRYASTFALASGQHVYQGRPSTAPLFCATYGPLSYIFFLPAALFPTIRATFAAGSLMSTAFLVVPFVILFYSFARSHKADIRDWGPFLLLSLTAIASLRTLNYVASQVTADSPSIGLMAICTLLLYLNRQQPRWTIALFSSTAMVLSVGCKQNMLVAGIAVMAGVWFCFPRRFWWTYLGFSAVASILIMGLVVAVYGDLHPVYFNSFVIPSHIPVIKANFFPGTYRLFESNAVLLFTLTALGVVWFLAKFTGSLPSMPPFVVVFFGIAAALSIPSIRIYAGAGGDINDFAQATYFFLLGTVVAGLELVRCVRSNGHAVSALRLLTVMAALTLLSSGLPTRFNAEWKAKMRQTAPAIQAYDYCKRNPGFVYFPQNPVAVYLAERKVYHTEWGVMLLQLAGEQLSREEIFRNIPQTAAYIAIPRAYMMPGPGAVAAAVAPHYLQVTVPALKDFDVYRIERESEPPKTSEQPRPAASL